MHAATTLHLGNQAEIGHMGLREQGAARGAPEGRRMVADHQEFRRLDRRIGRDRGVDVEDQPCPETDITICDAVRAAVQLLSDPIEGGTGRCEFSVTQ